MTATIIVETGEIVTGANSYVSVAELNTYASNRGITIAGTEEDLLIKAMDVIEAYDYIGVKRERLQSLQWPRLQVLVDGYYIDSNVIPTQLKNAQCEAAIAIDAGNNPLNPVEKDVKSETVGDISVVYKDSSAPATIVKTILNSVKKLLRNGDNANTFKVNKA